MASIIRATITSIVIKPDKNQKDYAEVKYESNGNERTARAFDAHVVDQLKAAQAANRVGSEAGLGIEENASEYQGKAVTYRNIVSLHAPEEGQPMPARSGGRPSGGGYRGRTPETEMQIMRQSSGDRATALTVNQVQFTSENITLWDQWFEHIFSKVRGE